MKKMKEKMLKMIQEQQPIKPKEIIESIAKNNKEEVTAESVLRSIVYQGVVILNVNRKITMPRKNFDEKNKKTG